MHNFRRINPDCLCCGSQIPHDTIHEPEANAHHYYCPKCADKILTGVVSTDGEVVQPPPGLDIPPVVYDDQLTIRSDVHFGTFEVWWTGRTVIGIINGRQVFGPDGGVRFVEKVRR